jgi:hypothetical protein
MPIHIIRMRVAVVVAAVLCMVACLISSRATRVPLTAIFEASVLRQPSPVLALIVVAVVFVACAAVVSMALGRWRPEAGLFAAAAGVSVFAIRGGSITQTLQYAHSGSVFIALAVELVLLYAVVGLAALLCGKLSGRPAPAPPVTQTDAENDDPHSLKHCLLAVLVQAIGMAVVMMLLGQSESKKQAMATVAVAAYIGAIAAHYTFPVRRGEWLAFGPLLVGVAGYLIESTGATQIAIGRVNNPLATPLPLHYVSMGIVGGVLGHWMSRKWQDEAAASA